MSRPGDLSLHHHGSTVCGSVNTAHTTMDVEEEARWYSHMQYTVGTCTHMYIHTLRHVNTLTNPPTYTQTRHHLQPDR